MGIEAHYAFYIWIGGNFTFTALFLPIEAGNSRRKKMKSIGNSISRGISVLSICALLAPGMASAAPKPLTPEAAHARILKCGLRSWVGVEVKNGAAFGGRIVGIDEQSFRLQLHNDPAITAVLYSDVVQLHTGLSRGAFWTILGASIGASVAVALVAHHEFDSNKPQLSTQPALQ
jgi:hypothetical protein